MFFIILSSHQCCHHHLHYQTVSLSRYARHPLHYLGTSDP
jgi:hypothetical protein